MGRGYYGDIEGRFWFAVQSSDAADRFGVYGQQPNYLEYDFTEDSLEEVEKELEYIKGLLGDKIEKLDEFYKGDRLYSTDEDISNYLGIPLNELRGIISDYADYELGMEIRDSIKKIGYCHFYAEL